MKGFLDVDQNHVQWKYLLIGPATIGTMEDSIPFNAPHPKRDKGTVEKVKLFLTLMLMQNSYYILYISIEKKNIRLAISS